jgi:DNA polymerase-3 subunit alpha
MQISKTLAGFTGGEADTLRKAMGKKIQALMKKMRERFIEGVIESGESKKLATELFDNFETFSQYGFVKAHAACYATIGYWTAYLKAHYPDAFMAALMTSDQDDIDRLAIEIAECQHMGLTVLPPDVNQSFVEFSVVPGKQQIRFGLVAVKGVGQGAVEEILRAREDGKFKSLEDFARRVSSSKVNRKAWDSLIKAGAFDSLGDRSDILFNLDSLLSLASKLQKEFLSGQTDLFGGMDGVKEMTSSLSLKSAPQKHTDKERLSWERDLLGLYLSAHPLDKYSDYLLEQTVPLNKLTADFDEKLITVGGIISTIRSITTKSGSKMAFVKLEDKFGETEIVVFPKQYEKISKVLVQDGIIKVKGRLQARDRAGNLQDEMKIIVEELQPVTYEELDNYAPTGKAFKAPKANKQVAVKISKAAVDVVRPEPSAQQSDKLYIHVKDTNDHERLLSMKRLLNGYPGSSEVVLVLGEDRASAIRMPFKIEISDLLKQQVSEIYGEECVVVK